MLKYQVHENMVMNIEEHRMDKSENTRSFLRLLGKIEHEPSFDVVIHHVSDGKELLNGLTESEILGRNLGEIISGDWFRLAEEIEMSIEENREVVCDCFLESLQKYFKIFVNPLVDELVEICFVNQTPLYDSNRRIHRQNKRLGALNRINNKLIQYSTSEDLISSIKSIFIKYLGYEAAQFIFIDPNFEKFSTIQIEGAEAKNCISRIKRFKEIYIDTKKDKSCYDCLSGEKNIKPCVVVPLVHYDDVYGALILGDKDFDVYDTDELDMLRQVSNNLSTVLQNYLIQNKPQLVKKELERYYSELDERNKELETKNKRLKELNQELQGAKEKAEEADRLKSAFLANMSHEIRTPLNGILGFCQLLKSTDCSDKEKTENFVNIIMDSSNQLMKTINNIIVYSKIQSDQAESGLIECSLNTELDNIIFECSNWRNEHPEKEIEFKKNFDLALGQDRLMIDIIHLKEILKNLLDNAFKFTNKGEIELLYRLDKDHLIFRVKDSGIGIPYDKKQIIFDRFRQSDDSKTREYGGVGLGLSIVSSLLSIINGQVWVQSKENEGTAFYFTIPYEIPDSNPELQEKLKNKEGGELKEMMNKQILVIEDDPASSEYLNVALEDMYNVIIAENGEEALESLENNEDIGLVLLDIRLPDISGHDLAREIKKKYPELPIIAQTAHAMTKDKQKSIEAGCDDYLAKPVSLEELIQTINRYI